MYAVTACCPLAQELEANRAQGITEVVSLTCVCGEFNSLVQGEWQSFFGHGRQATPQVNSEFWHLHYTACCLSSGFNKPNSTIFTLTAKIRCCGIGWSQC